MTDTDNRIAAYWATRAEGYSDRTEDELAGPRGTLWAARLKTALAAAPEGPVLDLGCGPGLFALLAARTGRCVTGLDVTPEMLERARANHRKYAPEAEAEFIEGDAAHLPFQDHSLAAVVSRYVIWNLPDPEAALKEIQRVLMPGGVLYYVDGNHYRYLTDEHWAALHEKEKPVYGHENRFVKGVDTRPMEEIAKSLPLTARERPAWDVGALEKLGYVAVRFDVLEKTRLDTLDLITEFSLTAHAE